MKRDSPKFYDSIYVKIALSLGFSSFKDRIDKLLHTSTNHSFVHTPFDEMSFAYAES